MFDKHLSGNVERGPLWVLAQGDLLEEGGGSAKGAISAACPKRPCQSRTSPIRQEPQAWATRCLHVAQRQAVLRGDRNDTGREGEGGLEPPSTPPRPPHSSCSVVLAHGEGGGGMLCGMVARGWPHGDVAQLLCDARPCLVRVSTTRPLCSEERVRWSVGPLTGPLSSCAVDCSLLVPQRCATDVLRAGGGDVVGVHCALCER